MQDHTREELKKYFKKGDVDGVNKLLASGDIESPDQIIDLFNNGNEGTLLMWACYFYSKHNDISLIRSLVNDRNANVNAQRADGFTAVMFAIVLELVPVLRFMVEEGRANLELRNRAGQTPLHVACGYPNSNEDIVRYLLDNDADGSAVCEQGATPLHQAALRGKCSIARLLLADDLVNMEAIDEYGRTPLHVACRKGNVDITELLLSHGANPDAVKHHQRRTPLIDAVKSKNMSCVKALIEAKVDLNKGDSHGRTALHHAVKEGNVDVVVLLLKAKADWSAKDHLNRLPVEMVKRGHRGSVKTLFVETLIGMVKQHGVFRDTILRGITQETCSLQTLEPDVVPHIAGYCDVPMGDELQKIRLEVDRLRSGRRGRKRKHSVYDSIGT